MEDSFRVRVDRAFGSLAVSSSSPSSMCSVWSLTDDEVERKEWNRGTDNLDREEIPCSSSFTGFFGKDRKTSQKESKNIRKEFRKDLEDLDDGDEDEQRGSGQSADRDGHYQEEWEIRSSIGLDCTLDNEEEEDECDKVAIGRKEDAGDYLYMRDISELEEYLNCDTVLPNSFREATRDPRANHLAASIRLKEDEAQAAKFNSSQASCTMLPVGFDPHVSEGENLKSILKRKANQPASKSQKRVRFDPECENNHESEMEEVQDLSTVTHPIGIRAVAENGSLLPQDSQGIPDYVWDPSKYTRYSFDSSSEVDEESNRQAYMDLLSMMKKPTSADTDLDCTCTASKSIVFTPKKKANNDSVVSSNEGKQTLGDVFEESVRKAGFPLGIAVGESQEGEACAMEEDELETATTDTSSSNRKVTRHYRFKVQLDDSDT
ncbi:uncharacterized protein LOC122653661 [Telopea speciosissima]|uniref:uncharacterized protein LOC122653661 n=1 Tax=Telopea speciosissima TaxID=54955 RepID=UPI001CC5872D|nr:uncharacterized protein LOC122653661 [Telopea speciosissima]